jgi:hypothetical protein
MPVPPDDPFAELLAGWCGKPWMPTRRIGAFLWCPSCHASQQTHDIGVARAAVDARHAEEIAIKDEKLAAYKQAMEGSYYEAWQAERLENTTPREQLVAAQRGQREAFKAGFLAVCTKKGDAASPQQPVGLVCPFCGDDDFDAVGLKLHLTTYCEAYASVEVGNRVY